MADINLLQFYQAIQQAAREATLDAIKTAFESKDFSTETTLAALKGLLDNGTAKMQLSGTVDVSDRANRALGQVTLTGSLMDLRGPAANRPSADAVDPGVTYWSIDTGDVSVSDGSTWRSLGVA